MSYRHILPPIQPKCLLLLLCTSLLLQRTSARYLQPSSLSVTKFRSRHPSWGTRKDILSRHTDDVMDGYTKSLLWGDSLRGGDAKKASEEDSDDDDDDDDSDSSESESEEEQEEEEEEESESEKENDQESESEEDNSVAVAEEGDFDEPLAVNPMMQMYASFGVMMFSRKVDIYDPKIVRMARFAFIGYLVLLQVFVLYVRLKAKAINDRTPVSVSNPLSNMLQSQLQGQDSSNAMMKNLASSFLSSESTILEYDLKQAKNMQGGILFNMIFMWFLHFKMEQIQPLLIQTVTGFMNLVYSPLFQVYVLGRNLERPFKNPAMKRMEETEAASKAADEEDNSTSETTAEEDGGDKEEDTATVEEEAESDEEDDESEEEASEAEEDDDDDEEGESEESEDEEEE